MTTLSRDYQETLREMHRDRPGWGNGGKRHIIPCRDIIHNAQRSSAPITSVLDYGCGKGQLVEGLAEYFPKGGVEFKGYDPGRTEVATKPDEPYDLVVCTDVLEHIEPDHLDAVLGDLYRLTRVVGYFVVNNYKANAVLPDGRNAHLIVENGAWWAEKLERFFDLERIGVNMSCTGWKAFPKRTLEVQ